RELEARRRIAQPIDPDLRTRLEHVGTRPAREMRYLLDRTIEHDEFKPQRAGKRTVVAVEGSRERAQLGQPARFSRRYQPIVESDAQRVVAIGGLEAAH